MEIGTVISKVDSFKEIFQVLMTASNISNGVTTTPIDFCKFSHVNFWLINANLTIQQFISDIYLFVYKALFHPSFVVFLSSNPGLRLSLQE